MIVNWKFLAYMGTKVKEGEILPEKAWLWVWDYIQPRWVLSSDQNPDNVLFVKEKPVQSFSLFFTRL